MPGGVPMSQVLLHAAAACYASESNSPAVPVGAIVLLSHEVLQLRVSHDRAVVRRLHM
jgi:hypothetical protein